MIVCDKCKTELHQLSSWGTGQSKPPYKHLCRECYDNVSNFTPCCAEMKMAIDDRTFKLNEIGKVVWLMRKPDDGTGMTYCPFCGVKLQYRWGLSNFWAQVEDDKNVEEMIKTMEALKAHIIAARQRKNDWLIKTL